MRLYFSIPCLRHVKDKEKENVTQVPDYFIAIPCSFTTILLLPEKTGCQKLNSDSLLI